MRNRRYKTYRDSLRRLPYTANTCLRESSVSVALTVGSRYGIVLDRTLSLLGVAGLLYAMLRSGCPAARVELQVSATAPTLLHRTNRAAKRREYSCLFCNKQETPFAHPHVL
jgi:hypothetical protein